MLKYIYIFYSRKRICFVCSAFHAKMWLHSLKLTRNNKCLAETLRQSPPQGCAVASRCSCWTFRSCSDDQEYSTSGSLINDFCVVGLIKHFSGVCLHLSSRMSYNYVVTAQKPTAVNACITGEWSRPVSRSCADEVCVFATCVLLAKAPALGSLVACDGPPLAASFCFAKWDVYVLINPHSSALALPAQHNNIIWVYKWVWVYKV